ncbi:DUF92 domain-containing protein [Lewinella sp. IMCC34183]|uniref:DUF92 domain-containing protein n=1 Tax=Lewinella sp. IMCC34183 TaxID=2248762 RepID=UPI000E24BC18|nr:DUF92 domain-containing protein [Lewinella sp. IMCC34183]
MLPLLYLILALAFAVVTVRRSSLSPGGALAAGILAGTVIATVGAVWLVPLFVFFFSSLLISKVLPVTDDAGDAKDRQPRDAVQVLCNGGVYGLVALLGLPPALLLVVMATAAADTWASEIGKYFRQPTYDILRLRPVPPGLSGGVSVSGTLAGAAGAAVVAALGPWLVADFGTAAWLTVTALGFGGMVADSVLGAGLQARYRHPDGQLSDRPNRGARQVGGLRWMTNDVVNLIAILLTTLLALLFLGAE